MQVLVHRTDEPVGAKCKEKLVPAGIRTRIARAEDKCPSPITTPSKEDRAKNLIVTDSQNYEIDKKFNNKNLEKSKKSKKSLSKNFENIVLNNFW